MSALRFLKNRAIDLLVVASVIAALAVAQHWS